MTLLEKLHLAGHTPTQLTEARIRLAGLAEYLRTEVEWSGLDDDLAALDLARSVLYAVAWDRDDYSQSARGVQP